MRTPLVKRPRAQSRRTLWAASAAGLIGFALLAAAYLTLPYPGMAKPLVLALYASSATAAHSSVRLRFEGTDARQMLLTVTSPQAIGRLVVVSNSLASCEPAVGSIEALQDTTPHDDVPLAVDANGAPAGRARILSGSFPTTVTRQSCRLTYPAQRFDFSNYGLWILTGYRFMQSEDREYAPGGDAVVPITDYSVHFDESLGSVQFEGGLMVQNQPTMRLLHADTSSTLARWRDPHLDQVHEFALWLLAAVFALGLSMVIEMVKPAFLET